MLIFNRKLLTFWKIQIQAWAFRKLAYNI